LAGLLPGRLACPRRERKPLRRRICHAFPGCGAAPPRSRASSTRYAFAAWCAA